jgi:parallel beta-helix repeat protein
VRAGLPALVLLLAVPAHAADGILEIDQLCIFTGCVPGDAPGFPVTTQAGQSYRLTSDIVVPGANVSAIDLADAATLDLAGHAIRGVTTCTGAPATCTGTGSGIGVSVLLGGTVRNGTIRGMGRDGVSGGPGTIVESMTIEQNGDDGVGQTNGASGWIVKHCNIHSNGDDGIEIDASTAATLVRNNTISRNGGDGFQGPGALVRDNTIAENGDYGLRLTTSSGYVGNAIYGNNGGDANPQVSSGRQLGGNLCGPDASCP